MHFLIPFSGMGSQQDKSLFMMEVNPGLPQVRAAAVDSVSSGAVHWVKFCVQPQPRDLVACLLEVLQSFAVVLDCPVKELLVGVQQENRIISISPKEMEFPIYEEMEFPIYGLHIADSLRKENLFTEEKTLVVESTGCSPSINSHHTAAVDGCTSAGAGR